MKKYLLASLLIIMISFIGAKSNFFDMRVGDFGCITRVVFEFTGKVSYKVKNDEKKLSISFASLKEGQIHLPVENSKNISNIVIKDGTDSSQVDIEFSYPIEVSSYPYYKENKNYIVVLDVYDKDYHSDKEKALATLLFKGQKFPLKKIEAEITNFSRKYSTDPLVNFYLGRLYATKKMKTKAIHYFKKLKIDSKDYLTAQAYIDNLNKGKYPLEEVKPDFLTTNNLQDSHELVKAEEANFSEEVTSSEHDSSVEQVGSSDEDKVVDNTQTEEKKETKKATSNSNTIWFLIIGASFIVIVILYLKNYKKNILIKELNAKLEVSNFELKALANKLEKGIIESSKTKDRIIIKLFNNGWKPEDIANELKTSIEIVKATISKEGRL